MNNGLLQKKSKQGVEDGHGNSRGIEKMNVEIAGVNKIRSGIFLE